MKRPLGLIVLVLSLAGGVSGMPDGSGQPQIVGRIYYLDGELSSYVPAENDWVAAVADAPFTADDAFFSGQRSRAELGVPNGSWIRVGSNTQIQFAALGSDATVADIAIGTARFYNKSRAHVIKITRPVGYVVSEPGSAFDMSVGESTTEVFPLRGSSRFVHLKSQTRYDLEAGSPPLVADDIRVASGHDSIDPDWDRWDSERDAFWGSARPIPGPQRLDSLRNSGLTRMF